jgi:hypothetical protein
MTTAYLTSATGLELGGGWPVGSEDVVEGDVEIEVLELVLCA